MPFKDIKRRKEYIRQWYFRNKIKLLEKARKYLKENRELINFERRERRHQLGISKRYRHDGLNIGISYTKEYIKFKNRAYQQRKKGGGKLSIKTIQLVYEDNIKKYGTLTCYLCELPIQFGKDTLEHKIPLSRGGTNEYNNLAIACQTCNCKKYTKTEEEFKNYETQIM